MADPLTVHCDLNITIATELTCSSFSFFVTPRMCRFSQYTIGPLFGFLQGIATMHIEQFESLSHLPTLDALDAEFREEKRCTAGRNRKGGDAMHFAVRPTQSEFPQHLGPLGIRWTERRGCLARRSSQGRRSADARYAALLAS